MFPQMSAVNIKTKSKNQYVRVSFWSENGYHGLFLCNVGSPPGPKLDHVRARQLANFSNKESIYVQDIFHIWNTVKSKRKICLCDLSSSVPFSVISDDNRKLTSSFQLALVISAVCCFHSSHACPTVGPVTTLNHP